MGVHIEVSVEPPNKYTVLACVLAYIDRRETHNPCINLSQLM